MNDITAKLAEALRLMLVGTEEDCGQKQIRKLLQANSGGKL